MASVPRPRLTVMASGAASATQPVCTAAWRTLRWFIGVLVIAYLILGVLIAAQGRPQQLWACPDASSPSDAALYAQPPMTGCKPTVSRQEQAKSFATTTVLGPAWLVAKTLNGSND